VKPPATLRGFAAYDDGTPASEALIAITNLGSGEQVAVVAADREGRFEAALGTGDYALAVTAERGFGWVETTKVPDLDAKLSLSRTCRVLAGRVKDIVAGTQVSVVRKSSFTGDIFVGNVARDGSFALCLPDGNYRIELRGPMVSFSRPIDLTATADTSHIEVDGFAERAVKQPPHDVAPIDAKLDALVADIVANDARLIGLGEATHGNAEMVTMRSTLTFELIRRAGVRLVMFENDAIAATQLDDYVLGGDIDLRKAVAGLGFWITDTEEFLHFLEDLRAYNATTRDKVHVWGVDVQHTEPAVGLLLANATALKLTADDQAMLKEVGQKRAASVLQFPQARRAALDALLARLTTPRSTRDNDLRIAVAARSLIVQLGYLDSDAYGARRDEGMAGLASYLVAQTSAPRACVWAHAGHIAREPDAGVHSMGEHLAAVAANRYYPIGFYIYQGTVRAWDAAGAVGVISHPIPQAPDFSVEGVVMAATRSPEVAWLPVKALPTALRTWFKLPRYVREVGAVYGGEADMLTLRAAGTAFDGLVIIKTAHDSTPTPTGVRKADQ
jgi:erythromycin esterase